MMSVVKKVLFAGIILSGPYCLNAQSSGLEEKNEILLFQEYNNRFGKTFNKLVRESAPNLEAKRIWTEWTLYSDGSIGNITLTNSKDEGEKAFIKGILSGVPKCDLLFIRDSLRISFPADTKTRKDHLENMKYSMPELRVISDTRPEYTGGMDEFVRYLLANFDQSLLSGLEKNKQNISVYFYVNKKGQIKDVDVRSKLNNIALKKELIKVIKNMPDWDVTGKTIKKDVPFVAHIYLAKDDLFKSEVLKSKYKSTDMYKPASFPGGNDRLAEFVQAELRYPHEALVKKIKGQVVCKFRVDARGKITNIAIHKGVSPELDREALRVINLLPDFEPAVFEGRNVECNTLIPINFRIPVGSAANYR